MRKSGWGYDFESRERFVNVLAKRATWRVRPYAPSDETEILALCTKIFGSTSTLKEWRWRHLENPVGEALVFVAEERDSGKLIGHAAAVPIDFKVGDFTIPVSLVNSALQKKLAEQREQLKLPEGVGTLRVENSELVITQK